MATDTLKSLSITNLDSAPIIENTAGSGAAAFDKVIQDYVTPTALGLQSTSSTYRVIRLPTQAVLQRLTLIADGALDTSTGLAVDVGAYWSDSTTDGTAPANQGNSISVNCFAAAIAYNTTFANVDALSNFSIPKRQEPLWEALGIGLTVNGTTNNADPGGYVDVVVAVHTAATTGASHNLCVRADFVY